MNELNNWLPINLFEEENTLLCRWLNFATERYTEPFFDETIQKCRRLPENRHLQKSASTIEMLNEWSASVNALTPDAFIFHVSRCGSTLMAQLLGINDQHTVLSEVPFFDEILRLKFRGIDANDIDDLYKASLIIYGRKRNNESRLFIKTDSWHLLFYEQLRRLYPDTLFVLLYRSPVEVIRSQKKVRGMQSIPNVIQPQLFGFAENDITYDLDQYMSKVLEKYFEKLLLIAKSDKKILLCNYADGVANHTKKIMELTGIIPSEMEEKKMRERMEYDGKRPQFVYEKETVLTDYPEYLNKSMELYAELDKYKIG